MTSIAYSAGKSASRMNVVAVALFLVTLAIGVAWSIPTRNPVRTSTMRSRASWSNRRASQTRRGHEPMSGKTFGNSRELKDRARPESPGTVTCTEPLPVRHRSQAAAALAWLSTARSPHASTAAIHRPSIRNA